MEVSQTLKIRNAVYSKNLFLMFKTIMEKHYLSKSFDTNFMCHISEKLYVCTCRMFQLMVHSDDHYVVH